MLLMVMPSKASAASEGAITGYEVMFDSEVQPLNALFPIDVKLAGKVMLLRLVQPRNASVAIVVSCRGREINISPLHPRKAPLPMVVTVGGSAMVLRAVHPMKALSPISVTSLMFTVCSCVICAKANDEISLTPLTMTCVICEA